MSAYKNLNVIVLRYYDDLFCSNESPWHKTQFFCADLIHRDLSINIITITNQFWPQVRRTFKLQCDLFLVICWTLFGLLTLSVRPDVWRLDPWFTSLPANIRSIASTTIFLWLAADTTTDSEQLLNFQKIISSMPVS